AIEHANDQSLGDHADDADDERRHQQHGHPDVDAMIGGHDGGVAAQHEELAVGQVDDAHHPEDDGEPDADEHESGDAVQDFERQNGYEVHRARTIDRGHERGQGRAAAARSVDNPLVLTLQIAED